MDVYCSRCHMILNHEIHDISEQCIDALGERVNFLTKNLVELSISTNQIMKCINTMIPDD